MKKTIDYGGILWEVTKTNEYYEVFVQDSEDNIVDYLSEDTFETLKSKYDER